MTVRFPLAAVLLLSMTGCVAIPLVSQGIAGAGFAKNLCTVAKMPGQTESLCDRVPMASLKQSFDKAPNTPPNTLPPVR